MKTNLPEPRKAIEAMSLRLAKLLAVLALERFIPGVAADVVGATLVSLGYWLLHRNRGSAHDDAANQDQSNGMGGTGSPSAP